MSVDSNRKTHGMVVANGCNSVKGAGKGLFSGGLFYSGNMGKMR